MRRNARCPQYPRPEVSAPRRGNSIVLVMGILVLLVIIATAFITRTHAGRVTSSAMQRTTLRDDNARVIAEMLAYEIGMALFPHPIDPNDPEVVLGNVATSDFARLSALRNPVRYGVDQDNDGNGLPDFPYNFAPYHVVPFTNWPDGPPGGPPNSDWPNGPGNPGGANLFEGNPVGNPGFGDARWLADIEPLRWDTDGDGILDTFSHWRHMTNIARPNNGWRIVGDISDVEFLLVTDLSIPVEQQLALRSDAFSSADLPSVPLTGWNFFGRWQNWLGGPGLGGYPVAYTLPEQIPPNFLDLKDLDGNATPHDFLDVNGIPQDRPQDEFIPGTARHTVNRVLVDTDGDGFTDSFWFLAPTMTERGIRQIVAMRIIDNSAMLNANVATRFDRENSTGATPSDLALVGDVDVADVTVGLFDNPAHHETGPFLYGDTDIGYNPDIWDDTEDVSYLAEIGVLGNSFFPLNLGTAGERLQYWVASGRNPLSPALALTPFTFTEELELRMFNGQNYPWIASRFERAVQASVLGSLGKQFLHANLGREESSEYLDQLSNRELLFDHRKQLTMYNGARNEEMPPWLWWRWDIPQDVEDDAAANPGEPVIERFLAQARTKVDLRQPELVFGPRLPLGLRNFRQRLAPTLLLALIDGDETSGTSYFGEYSTADQTNRDRARLAAAGLAANIREWRDDDSDLKLADAEPLPKLTAFGPAGQVRMLGMERQPFLLEAFIGQVYRSQGRINCPEVPGEGENYVTSDAESTPIVIVQIANPYGRPIDDMSQFAIRVFGQTFRLNGTLGRSTEQEPRTAIVYSIPQAFAGDPSFRTNWLDFLDLELDDLQADTVLLNATNFWTDDVADFASSSDEAVELLREVDGVQIVIDRIDDPNGIPSNSFRSQVSALNEFPYRPPDAGFECDPPNEDNFFNGIRIGNNDYFVIWARAGRVWGFDFDSSQQINANERAPRFVFSRKPDPDLPEQTFDGRDGLPIYLGNAYEVGQNPDTSPWIERIYVDPSGADRTRKPTFFPTKTVYDVLGQAVYQPFNDPTPPKGTVHFADNGVKTTDDYFFPFPLQMLQKDEDFEQVGELLNVWMFGHELKFDLGDVYRETTQTFSEFLFEEVQAGYAEADEAVGVNRLRVKPTEIGSDTVSPVIGNSRFQPGVPEYLLDPLHAVPALPAGLRVLDAFVCDDRGVNGTVGVDEFLNANGFTGKITPGLINVNTAPPEVMRSLPHWYRLVHEDPNSPLSDNPFVRLPEAIVQYRERFGDPNVPNAILPIYGDRGDDTFIEDLRGERGIASIGEIGLLNRSADGFPPLEPDEDLYKRSFRADFAGLDPFGFDFAGQPIESTQISTDVNDVFDPNLPGDAPDEVAQDAEELNLLFAGMSNMITTRSDVFTVYFKVRSFKQNPTTGVWDATNPEFIVDDSRYVMLVDRSEVNHPNDKPKILYLEKLPK